VSPLTKFFVVLLVVLSIFQTAATIVFVNKTEDANERAQALQAQVAAQDKLIKQRTDEANAARALAERTAQTSGEQVRAAQRERDAALAQIAAKDVEIARLESANTIHTNTIAQTAEALKASEAGKSQYQTMVADLRKTVDELNRKGTELNLEVTNLTARLEATERARRWAEEQLAEAQQQVQKLGQVVRDAGIDVAEATPGLRGGAPTINGVIREVRKIAGREYATISVGSADGVVKGMEFKVIDRGTGNFLGILIVDSVEPNEAVGRLEGPRIAEIRPNNEVRTQL
jgi:chromosome segregation ATPase